MTGSHTPPGDMLEASMISCQCKTASVGDCHILHALHLLHSQLGIHNAYDVRDSASLEIRSGNATGRGVLEICKPSSSKWCQSVHKAESHGWRSDAPHVPNRLPRALKLKRTPLGSHPCRWSQF
jgi:hypothetical protein